MALTNQHPVILFDGFCNLCSGWVRFLIRKDRKMKFRFAASQSTIGQKLLHEVGMDNIQLETVLYLKGDTCFRESSAILEILKDLGGVWALAVVFKIIPSTLRNATYQYLAKKRYHIFGKRSSCYSPTPENQKRFLT
jgi:predicted DCC family thiol-disulfide oxidoreductase YuxK